MLKTITLCLLCSAGFSHAESESLPVVDTSGTIPSDAIRIFDGGDMDMLAGQDGGVSNWKVKDGTIVVQPGQQERQQGLWTKLHFRDAQIHAEFYVPKSKDRGTKAANSGLYFHGLFELQIIDSYENPMDPAEIVGGIYKFNPPAVNAARPTGAWQVYDILFQAPRRNKKGKAITPGAMTVFLNGVLVQWNTPILEHKSEYAPLYFRTTAYTEGIRDSILKTEAGPVQLQDHDHPVQFRNIWIRPLDDKSFIYTP